MPFLTHVSISVGISSTSSSADCAPASCLFREYWSSTEDDWEEKDSHADAREGMSCLQACVSYHPRRSLRGGTELGCPYQPFGELCACAFMG